MTITKGNSRRSPGIFRGRGSRCLAWVLLCLMSLPAPALAGETIVWNGKGQPGTNTALRPDPMGNGESLFPSLSSPSGNTVTVNGDVSDGGVHGGWDYHTDSTNSKSANNSVIVNSGGIGGVFGGTTFNTSGNGTATGNTVTINNGEISGFVIGGDTRSLSGNAEASGNTITVNGGKLDSWLFGGVADTNGSGTSDASNNAVIISGGEINGYIYGSAAYNHSGNTTTTSNTATVSGGKINGYVFGSVAGNVNGNAVTSGNAVIVSDGSIDGEVLGGDAHTNSGSATALSNTVTVTGGAIGGDVIGGWANTNIGIATGTAIATGNTVAIHGGTIRDNVYGGISNIDANIGTGSATNNIVIISGGEINGSVYGGFVGKWVVANLAHGEAALGDAFSGNTLELRNTSPLTLGGVYNFQYLNFYLADSVTNGSTILRIAPEGDADINGSTVNVGFSGGTALAVGQQITLIDATSGALTGTLANTATSGEGMVGISKLATFDLTTDSNMLYATLTSLDGSGGDDGEEEGENNNPGHQIRSQLKSLAESRIAGMGVLTMGGDMLTMQAIPQLHSSARNAPAQSAQAGFIPFGVAGGGSMRYDSGSHVDVDGFNMVAGLGWNLPLNEGRSGNLLLGAFFEAGWGDYDAHTASVKGDGDVSAYGGGILARYDSKALGSGTLYTDASFRMGRAKTDYNSSDFRNASGTGKVDFDSSALYTGAHLGVGYIWNISEAASLDMYTRYLWARQDSDSVTIEGDGIRFKTMDSHRWCTGATFAYTLETESGRRFTPYLGAAYEHEFDGKARASVNGEAIDAPDLKGGTGIGELGFAFAPSADSGLSLDLGMQGYTGTREGVGGSFRIKYAF